MIDPDTVVHTHEDGTQVLARQLTCFSCIFRETCRFVDDPYNTQGACLASK